MTPFRTPVILSAVVATLAAGTAAAGGGPTMAKLVEQGWDCFPGDVMIHCTHPNIDVDALIAGTLPSVPSVNFALGDQRFLGTEILVRADLGDDGRPCNQGTEPEETKGKRTVRTYEAVDFSFPPDGIAEYFSCHHNNDL